MPVRPGLYRSTGEGKRSQRTVKRLLSLLWCLDALPSSISPPLPLHLSPCRLIHAALYTLPQIWLIPRKNISISFFVVLLCYSLFFHFILLRVIPGRTISPALPRVLLSFPLTVLKFAFQPSLDFSHQSLLIAPHTYLLHLTPVLECRSAGSAYVHASTLQPHPPTSLDYKADTWPADGWCSKTSTSASCSSSTDDEMKQLK